MRKRGYRLGWLATSFLTLFLVSACSSSDPGPSDAHIRFQQLVDSKLALTDLDEDTRARIQAAGESGVMTFEDYKQGFQAYVDCRKAVGVDVRTYTADLYGVPRLRIQERSYVDDIPADFDDLRFECARKTIFPLEEVYDAQVRNINSHQERANSFRKQMVECLAPFGIDVPDKASIWELRELSYEASLVDGTSCEDETGMYIQTLVPDDLWED